MSNATEGATSVTTLQGHIGQVTALTLLPNNHLASVGVDGTTRIWNLENNKIESTYQNSGAPIGHIAISPDGKTLVTGGEGGIQIRVAIDKRKKRQSKSVVTLLVGEDERTVSITSHGYFASTSGGTSLLKVVAGLKVYSIDQFYDHLGRADLVEELLKGDKEGVYADTSWKLNLKGVLASGPAPEIDLLKKSKIYNNSVSITVRLNDAGGGVGKKLVWRVNGKTQGNSFPSDIYGKPTIGRSVKVEQGLQLHPDDENIIEVTAYNSAGLMASRPLKVLYPKTGVADVSRPHVHILTIAVDDYKMKEFRLQYAVKDAVEIAKALKVAGEDLFGPNISVYPLEDRSVTRQNIGGLFHTVAKRAKPQDLFILFVAGHGKTVAGQYFYYPADLNFDDGQSYKDGIGLDTWQQWLGKVGHVKKSLLIFDTCESGGAKALLSTRGGHRARQTALEQFEHATGHNLIAATRQGAVAYEGYRGHGVLTYAIIDAFRRASKADDPSKVTVFNLSDVISDTVPEITNKLWGERQRPIPILNSNFPIGLRVLSGPKKPICVGKGFISTERVALRKKPSKEGGVVQGFLPAYNAIEVHAFHGDWAQICRAGSIVGFVPTRAIEEIK